MFEEKKKVWHPACAALFDEGALHGQGSGVRDDSEPPDFKFGHIQC
jgi:hypothetical protein